MAKSIISISAFGFADTIVIDGKVYMQDSNLPSVVIEDSENKLYMYGQDALYERTGIGLSDNDHYSSRIPVALLWQQLKHLQPRDENKQHAANSLAKYIIQLACDAFDEHKRATANTAPAPVNDTVAMSSLSTKIIRTNKAYLQSHCQLVICIPDNFDEAEQQALINSFSGFEVQLLWRSIATLLGHFNAYSYQAIVPEPSFANIMETAKPATHLSIASMAEESQAKVATSQEATSFYEQLSQHNKIFATFFKTVDAEDSIRTPESIKAKMEAARAGLGSNNSAPLTPLRLIEHADEQPQEAPESTPNDKDTATVHVLYIGPDSIDLSSYDLKLHTDQRYVIPIRRESVYRQCASDTSFLQYAISYAYTFVSTKLIESLSSAQKQNDIQLLKQLQNAVIAQVIYQFPEAWGQSDASEALRVLRVPQTQSQSQSIDKWCHVYELLPASLRAQVRSCSSALHSFYKLYGCDKEQSIPNSNKDRTEWIRNVINARQLEKLRANKPHECLLITGPMLYGNSPIIDSFSRTLAHQLPLGLSRYNTAWPNMALGGCLFQERFNLKDYKTYPTYFDRLTKLSMVISNQERTEYQEQVLIADQLIAPNQDIPCPKVRLSINKGSDHIELYVSTDPDFNDDSINLATETPFTLQDPQVSVQKATLTFASGRKAQEDEPVLVWVEQRALSGYAKIHIKPNLGDGKASSVLPPHGEVQVFDPSKKVDFTETLPKIASAYPPLSKPRNQLAATIKYGDDVTEDVIIFRSGRKQQDLVYYNGEFGSKIIKEKICERLNQDHTRYYASLLYAADINDFDKVCSILDQCLPFSQAKLFGDPGLEGITNTAALAVEQALKLGITPDKTKNKLLHRYCMFVPDSQGEVNKCCQWLLKMAPFNTQQMNDVLLLIENHPQVFSPESKDFSMGAEFARALLNSSKDIIRATVYNQDLSKDIIRDRSVIGKYSLSLSLRGMLYSLLYRKEELNFIDEPEIEELEQLLDYTLLKYQQIDSLIKQQKQPKTRRRTSSDLKGRQVRSKTKKRTFAEFQASFHSFVEDKLTTLLPEVKKYLRKKGSNPNIMSALLDLEEY